MENLHSPENTERGFTLIELLTVVSILSMLTVLSLQAFNTYRSNAANASVDNTLHSAVIAAEASQTDPAHLPPAVGWYFQKAPGEIQDNSAEEYLSGMKMPSKTCVWAMYDPECTGAFCMSDFVMVAHCMGSRAAQWVKWGDGWSMTLRDIPGRWGWCC